MIRKLFIGYLIAVLFFGWGYVMVRFQVFPWNYVQPIERNILDFVKGADGEETQITEKLVNDLNIRPSRQLYKYQKTEGRNYQSLPMENLNSRRQSPLIYSTDEKTLGYIFIYGTFDYDDSLHAGILLDSNNQIVHKWTIDQRQLKQIVKLKNAEDGGARTLKSASRRLPQGLELLADGALVLNEGIQGNGMQHVDVCGDFKWSALGKYHHNVSHNPADNSLWAFKSGDIVKLDFDTGEILNTITHQQIHQANPDISIFTPRRRIHKGRWLSDPFHENDVDPLTPKLASAFPQFSVGDLLVSYRSLNLIVVLDPKTLEIKWWRTGAVRRPHDADWQPDGTITIYNNNMREPNDRSDGELDDLSKTRYTDIVKIDPRNYDFETIYRGENDNVYSGARGMHQVLPSGNIVLASPHQGRVLEVNQNGETVFEFVNTYDDAETLIMSEVRWFSEDFFSVDFNDPNLCN